MDKKMKEERDGEKGFTLVKSFAAVIAPNVQVQTQAVGLNIPHITVCQLPSLHN